MAIIALALVVIVPLLLRCILCIFDGELSQWIWKDDVPTEIVKFENWFAHEGDGEHEIFSGLNLLPDFLGGMAGILIGFILDFRFIDKIKMLHQYKSMLSPLNAEFKEITNNYNKIETDINKAIEKFKQRLKPICLEGENFDEVFEELCFNLFQKYNANESIRYNNILDDIENTPDIIEEIDKQPYKEQVKKKIKKLSGKEIATSDLFEQLVDLLNDICCYNYISLPNIESHVLEDILEDYENSAVLAFVSSKNFPVEDTLRNIYADVTEIKEAGGVRLMYEPLIRFKDIVENHIKDFQNLTTYGKRKGTEN